MQLQMNKITMTHKLLVLVTLCLTVFSTEMSFLCWSVWVFCVSDAACEAMQDDCFPPLLPASPSPSETQS